MGVKFTVCSDETHESAAATRRTINPVLHNIHSGWFHTHINLWGPSNLSASVVPPQHPLPSSRVQGSPHPEQRGPASTATYIIWVCLPWEWGCFGLGSSWAFRSHKAAEDWSDPTKQIHHDYWDFFHTEMLKNLSCRHSVLFTLLSVCLH